MHIKANLKDGLQTYEGNLFFYDDGFEYKAKSLNALTSFGKVLYTEIKRIKQGKTFGIISNRIIISTSDDREYRFVVINAKSVIEFIKNKAGIV